MSRFRRALLAGIAAFFAIGVVFPASAQDGASAASNTATHTVEMLNKHPENPRQRMVFYPRILKIAPGDTVEFVASAKGHNTASSRGMIPEGAQPWKGGINENMSITLSTPGIYGYNCTPHRAIGMVGLIIVEGPGMLDNLDAAKAVRQIGKSRQAWEQIWAEAEEQGYLSAS